MMFGAMFLYKHVQCFHSYYKMPILKANFLSLLKWVIRYIKLKVNTLN